MEAVKAMIHDQDMPMDLWEEAARTVVYVQNISPHRALGNKTPEEMFTGENPKVSHLQIFGCPVYVHVPKDKRSNLDPSGKKGVFLGYSETSKEYRIYIPGYKKIEISRYFTFDEDATFSRSRQCLQMRSMMRSLRLLELQTQMLVMMLCQRSMVQRTMT
jgi:hypothetical protein